MAIFLTTTNIAHYIEEIIKDAIYEIVLVCPYFKITNNFIERLNDADKRNVAISIIYGKKELDKNQIDLLSKLKNIYIYYYENLHAKCYFNDSKLIITSMNMYEFSEKKNREMGVLLSKENDEKLFTEAVKETESIINSSVYKIDILNKRTNSINEIEESNGRKIELLKVGYCIRCLKKIKYNPQHPFCMPCYTQWSKYNDSLFREKYCHNCGDEDFISMMKPECYSCFKKNNMEFR